MGEAAVEVVAKKDGRTEGHRCEEWLGFLSTTLQQASQLVFCPGCGDKVKDRYHYAEQGGDQVKGALLERSKEYARETFLGGYHEDREIEIFRHGMDTVWNMVRADARWVAVEAPRRFRR